MTKARQVTAITAPTVAPVPPIGDRPQTIFKLHAIHSGLKFKMTKSNVILEKEILNNCQLHEGMVAASIQVSDDRMEHGIEPEDFNHHIIIQHIIHKELNNVRWLKQNRGNCTRINHPIRHHSLGKGKGCTSSDQTEQ